MNSTPIFERNWDSNKKIVINRGGTRSSKTYSIAQICAVWLITGAYGENQYCHKGTWSTVRKYRTTLDSTVVKDFEEILHNEGWYRVVKHDKTRKTYKYKGRTVEFIGADDEQKLRGAKRNILYCNEANELEYKKEFFQLLMRTEDKIFIDFNPDDPYIWINTQLEQKRKTEEGDVDVIVSNYNDNTFLPLGLVKEIELLQKTDKEFWKIYGLGEYGHITGLVYEEVKQVDNIPNSANFVAYGGDFGYSNDPTAVVGVYRDGTDLFFREEIYRTGLTNRDIFQEAKSKGLELKSKYIFDSAEPKSIEELYRMGINAHPATKGKDSIKNGIDILKRFNLHVTTDSKNLIKEFRNYKWTVDKNGNSLNKPVDIFNHGMDAIRYVALKELYENRKGRYRVI